MRSLIRAARILLISVGFGLRFAVSGSRRPRVLRRHLERCGGAFVKLGQLLAMRYDLLPAPYCEELASLLDELPPIPFERVRPVIESELGRPCAEAFANLDPIPVSTASVAQVHVAELHDGRRAAVKVLRPGIEAAFRADLLLMRAALAAVTWLRPPTSVDLVGFGREVRALAEEELDFRIEARNITVLRELLLADDVAHTAPEVFFDWSTRRVLTMSWLEGVSVRDLLAAVNSGDEERLREMAARGVRPEPAAELLFRSIVTQCFTHRIFHADPHAANLILLEDGTLGYVDFGMIGWIDEPTWDRQFRLNLAISRGDLDGAYQALLDTLEPLPTRDLRRFEVEFKQLLQRWLFATRVPTTSLRERSVALFFMSVFRALRKQGLRMPIGDLRLNRTLLISDIVILRLHPGMNRLELLDEFFSREFERSLASAWKRQHSRDEIQESALALLGAPHTLHQLGGWLQRRLPSFSREYRRDASRTEKALLLGLSYFRLLVSLAVVVVAAAPALQAFEVTRDLGAQLADSPLRWVLVLIGLLLVALVTRMIYILR